MSVWYGPCWPAKDRPRPDPRRLRRQPAARTGKFEFGNLKTRTWKLENSKTWKLEHLKTWNLENLKTRKLENLETRKLEYLDTWKLEHLKTWKLENLETRKLENLKTCKLENLKAWKQARGLGFLQVMSSNSFFRFFKTKLFFKSACMQHPMFICGYVYSCMSLGTKLSMLLTLSLSLTLC